jgi:molybdopterin molybdotransferase
MLSVKSIDEAAKQIKDEFSGYKLSIEEVCIEDALGRVLAEDIFSDEDIPHFKRATLDGYAVKASDTFGASEAIPAMLKLVGQVKMGEKADFALKSGETAYVPTGGFIPDGADSIAMIEIAEQIKNDILIYKSIAPVAGIIFKGDDIKCGEKAIEKRQIMTKKYIGTLAALGKSKIKVFRKLTCGILSTGDEIASIDEIIDENNAKIRDVNSHFLKAQATEFGCNIISYGICRDNKEDLIGLIKKAHSECDIVLISGGSSVGIMDATASAIVEATNANVFIHGLAMKPGKPTIIGKANGKALVGLPGHPVSAFFVMQEIVGTVINAMNGTKEKIMPTIKAKISVNISSNNGRDEFIPVKLEEINNELIATPISYKSGLITLLSGADGYIKIPRLAEGLDKDTMVYVRVL